MSKKIWYFWHIHLRCLFKTFWQIVMKYSFSQILWFTNSLIFVGISLWQILFDAFFRRCFKDSDKIQFWHILMTVSFERLLCSQRKSLNCNIGIIQNINSFCPMLVHCSWKNLETRNSTLFQGFRLTVVHCWKFPKILNVTILFTGASAKISEFQKYICRNKQEYFH